MAIAAAAPTPVQIASYLGNPLPSGEKPKVINFSLPFPTPTFNGDTYSLNIDQSVGAFSGIRAMFVDATGTGLVTTINFPDSGPIIIPPFSRGWYPVTTASKSITVQNSSGQPSVAISKGTVRILLSNFPVPPIQTSLGTLALGSQDHIEVFRLGKRSANVTLLNAGFTTLTNFASPFSNLLLFPGYFVNALTVSYAFEKAAAVNQQISIIVGDWNGAAFNTILWEGVAAYSPNGPQSGLLVNLSGITYFGTSGLAITASANSTDIGSISANVMGGSTNYPGS